MRCLFMFRRIASCIAVALLSGAAMMAQGVEPVTMLQTPDGVRFGIQGEKPTRPAPTLFVLASGIDQTLPEDTYPNIVAMAGIAFEDPAGMPIDFEFGVDLILDGLERLLPGR